MNRGYSLFYIDRCTSQLADSVQEMGKRKLVHTAAWLCGNVPFVYLSCWLMSFWKFAIIQPASAHVDCRRYLQTCSGDTSASSSTNWHVPLFYTAKSTQLWRNEAEFRLAENYIRRFSEPFIMLSLLYKHSVGGIRCEQQFLFCECRIVLQPYLVGPTNITKDADTNMAAQIGTFKCT